VNLDINKLLESTQLIVDVECATKVAGLLNDTQSRMVDGLPTRETVKQLLPTLQARLTNAIRNGKHIYGLADTIKILTKIDSDVIILGYGFISPKAAANFYSIDGSENIILGISFVDR
jgi:hypothetical protein